LSTYQAEGGLTVAKLFIGTSGWSYAHWAGTFYPMEITKARWLKYYCYHFATVEINSSFYRLPRETTFQKWRESVPGNFVFAVKASRYITHIKKLNEPVKSTELFLTRARFLGSKLGPMLFQIPPGLKVKLDRLEQILRSRPKGLSYCFEFRHTSWFCREVYDLLRQYNSALCIADSPKFPLVIQRTADFSYFRLHGSTILYGSRYSSEELKVWAERIERFLDEDADVYVYFDNDAEGYAVMNALELSSLLSRREELQLVGLWVY
jgi:uncharacterized protein YecE (DUF72 family)